MSERENKNDRIQEFGSVLFYSRSYFSRIQHTRNHRHRTQETGNITEKEDYMQEEIRIQGRYMMEELRFYIYMKRCIYEKKVMTTVIYIAIDIRITE